MTLISRVLASVDHFNSWYDKQPEPRRFGMFLLAIVLALLPVQLGVSLGHAWLAGFGFVVFAVITLVGCMRIFELKDSQVATGLGILSALLLLAFWLGRRS